MDLFQKCYDYNTVRDAVKYGYYPYFHELETGQDIQVVMEGKNMIMIGSNNYLGLTSHPEVIEAGVAALKKYGSGVSGSRFLNGTLDIHVKLEEELADFLHKESVMTFSTGFQSNLGILGSIAGRDDIIFCDKENHASIYDGCKLSYAEMVRYKHSDMADLESRLSKADPEKGKLIVTDGIFSMSGDICKLPDIVRLAKKYGARVMVDDAHGFGVIGENGRGTASFFGLEDEVDMIMGTFSKSLASLGGFLAAKKDIVDYVRHNSRPFIFCAAITPSNCACAHAALKILKREPERVKSLLDISDYVRKGLNDRGLQMRKADAPVNVPIIPIYTYDMLRTMVACNVLFNDGVFVNPVIPPAAPSANECLIRTSYTATHTRPLMDKAMDIIEKVLKTLPDKIDLSKIEELQRI